MTARDPLVLGINAAYHETCAALVGCDGVRFAVEEERLTRMRHGKAARVGNPDALPWTAIDACLANAGASLADVAAVAYSLAPGLRQTTVGRDPYPVDAQAGWGTAAGEAEFDRHGPSPRRARQIAPRAPTGPRGWGSTSTCSSAAQGRAPPRPPTTPPPRRGSRWPSAPPTGWRST